ncbi:hypothetical protein PVAND_003805 [Polypedilum vanderplanki]|uniref:Uncharacterized protein n=1 Tax=Polypedilum vanderplanki TaxID=319348 RepID=A0A9J6BV48_POLVA|nr:hypothetical protein PVAND_003805 [Polypedilum vanderplanki]
MKIIFLVLSIVLIFSINQCNARSREKRTLNTFLRYFGFKIVPLEDVEFVTEKIIESSRNPKAIRIQTLAPKMEEDNKTIITTTAKPATTTASELKFEKLPQELIEASALNLDALIDALTIMKAPNVSNSNTFNQSNFIINVPSDDQKSEKFVESSNNDNNKLQMEFMQPPKIDIDQMQMMQPPAIAMNFTNTTEFMSDIADEHPSLMEISSHLSSSSLSLPLPQLSPEQSFPFLNAFEVVRSKEISIPSNEIVVGNSILVSDSPFQQKNLQPQPSFPTFQPIPMVFANGIF